MRCEKCGHDDVNPVGKCMVEVVEKNVEITGVDGKKYIKSEMMDVCGCSEPIHREGESMKQLKLRCYVCGEKIEPKEEFAIVSPTEMEVDRVFVVHTGDCLEDASGSGAKLVVRST